MSEPKRINVSRSVIKQIDEVNVESLGASYTHVKSLKGVLGPNTKRVVMQHAFLESLEGFEDTLAVDIAYIAFNRIVFRPEDKNIPKIGVLDLAGNPISSLVNCPPCHDLIVSSTLIKDLTGCPEGVEILRCGHSTHILSLRGCPKSVKLIECSCTPNLIIDPNDLPSGLEKILRD